MLLVVQVLCVSGSAWAGCNHLVTSRTDPGRLPSILDALLDDLARPSDGIPTLSLRAPVLGGFLLGSARDAGVPVGAFDWLVDSWACCAQRLGHVVHVRFLLFRGLVRTSPDCPRQRHLPPAPTPRRLLIADHYALA